MPAPPPASRRACLRCLGLAGAGFVLGAAELRVPGGGLRLPPGPVPEPPEPAPAARTPPPPAPLRPDPEKQLRFDESFADDVVLGPAGRELLRRVVARLGRVQEWVGHGRFNLLGFDELRAVGRRSGAVGELPGDEVDFLDELFHTDARQLGFFGEKVLHRLTARLPAREVVKVEGSGHYLLKGPSLERYRRIRRDLGPDVILTSGLRGVVKQFHLFLAKAHDAGGNLSRAARSLAPPGYSYHAAGDFDLGQRGLGSDNFTSRFATTDAYRRLLDLGYVGIRYPRSNPDGVRFEPWHVRVT